MNIRRAPKPLLGLVVPALCVAGWETAVRGGWLSSGSFPLPTQVFRQVSELTKSGLLFSHLLSSLLRVFTGYVIGVSAAVPLGLLMGISPRLLSLLRPSTELLRTVSPIAWIPLAIVWFGIGDMPAIFIISITCFSPVLLSTISAVTQVPALYQRVARGFGASPLRQIITVTIPASAPGIFVGLRIALGMSWLVIVAAEMVGMRSGLGYLIMDARNMLRSDLVIASMCVIGIVGLLLDTAMRVFERALCSVEAAQ